MKYLAILITLFFTTGCLDGLAERNLYPFETVNERHEKPKAENVEGVVGDEAYFLETKNEKDIIIYFHGNGESASDVYNYGLANILLGASHLIVVEYPGIKPLQDLKPSQDALVKSGLAAMTYAKMNYPMKKITFFCRSLGNAVCLQVAKQLPPDRLILVSPWTSFKDAAKASPLGFLSGLVSDKFYEANKYDSLSASRHLLVKAIVIHGLEDKLVPAAQGKLLAETNNWTFVGLEGLGHNDIFNSSKTWDNLREYLSK